MNRHRVLVELGEEDQATFEVVMSSESISASAVATKALTDYLAYRRRFGPIADATRHMIGLKKAVADSKNTPQAPVPSRPG